MALAHPANASTVQLGLDLPRHFAAKWAYKEMHLKERSSDSLIDQSPETPVVMADLQRAIDKRRVDNIKLSLAYADFAFTFSSLSHFLSHSLTLLGLSTHAGARAYSARTRMTVR